MLGGPLVSALANKVGFRITTIIGAFTACTGFAVSYFASSIYFLYVSYGCTGGFGFCLIYIPSVCKYSKSLRPPANLWLKNFNISVTVGYYFEKWRALATGISLCGSGIGTFIFAPLTEYFLKQQGWRITLLIQAGIKVILRLFYFMPDFIHNFKM